MLSMNLVFGKTPLGSLNFAGQLSYIISCLKLCSVLLEMFTSWHLKRLSYLTHFRKHICYTNLLYTVTRSFQLRYEMSIVRTTMLGEEVMENWPKTSEWWEPHHEKLTPLACWIWCAFPRSANLPIFTKLYLICLYWAGRLFMVFHLKNY